MNTRDVKKEAYFFQAEPRFPRNPTIQGNVVAVSPYQSTRVVRQHQLSEGAQSTMLCLALHLATLGEEISCLPDTLRGAVLWNIGLLSKKYISFEAPFCLFFSTGKRAESIRVCKVTNRCNYNICNVNLQWLKCTKYQSLEAPHLCYDTLGQA